MCNFTYIVCRSCPTGFPCRIYNPDVDYCEIHLNGFWWMKDRPVPICLVVEMPDENNDLDYLDNNIIFRTKPGDRGKQFGEIGCYEHKFDQKDWPSIPCPYHKPGGLKERGIMVRKYRDDAEGQKQKKKDREKAAENGPQCYKNLKAMAKEEEQRARARQLKEEKSCCVVQ